MNNPNISIQDRTKKLAVRVIRAYAQLNQRNFDDAGKVLAKQFLRSGTSIGANCTEARAAQSTKDFISKYEIALKETHEFIFWIEVFIESELVEASKFSWLLEEANRWAIASVARLERSPQSSAIKSINQSARNRYW